MEGVDAVLGRIGNGSCKEWREQFHKEKQSPGSGVLSVSVVQDGPTRILRITDENKKVHESSLMSELFENGHNLKR